MIKPKDLAIIAQLRTDGRMGLRDIGRKTEIPISTVYDRLQEYKELIPRYAALLNFSALGYKSRAFVLLKTKKENLAKLMNYLSEHKNTNSLFRINNGWDILLDCVFTEMNTVEKFVDELELKYQVKGKEIHYILDTINTEMFMTKENET